MGVSRKKHLIRYILLCWAALIVGCSQEPETITFEREKSLTHELVELDSALLVGYPFMQCADSFLAILDLAPSDYRLNIINLRDLSLAKRGRAGNGPNELNTPYGLQKSSSPNSVDIYDTGKNAILTYHLDSCFRAPSYLPQKTNLGNGSVHSVTKADNRTLISTGAYAEGRYRVASPNGQRFYYGYPNDGVEMPNAAKGMAYQGFTVYHPGKKRYVATTHFGLIVDLLSLDAGQLKRIKYIENTFPRYTNNSDERSYSAPIAVEEESTFWGLCHTDEHIYYMYSGRSRKAFAERNTYSEEIWASDWDLNFHTKYRLDVEIMAFCADGADKNIYAMAFIDGTLRLVRFKI